MTPAPEEWDSQETQSTEDSEFVRHLLRSLPICFRAVVKELVETEQEFVKDLDHVVQKYLLLSETKKVPKVIRDNFEVIFGNLKEIAEFHRT
jgi:hypothetical protein